MKFLSASIVLVWILTTSDGLIIGQSGSAFTRHFDMGRTAKIGCTTRGDMQMYNDPASPQNAKESGNMWKALATTEKWISDFTSGENNPFIRKEVSYVCETSTHTDEIVATIFRRLREMRETGHSHGKKQDELRASQGSKYKQATFRKSVMMVITSSQEDITDFTRFNETVHVINSARRNSRDFLVDPPPKNEEISQNWVTSISMGHLHPKYGEDELKTLVAEAEKNKKDEIIVPEIEVYKMKRLMGRRSPFPSLVLEARSTPYTLPDGPDGESDNKPKTKQGGVERSDVEKLEALFRQSATFEHENDGEAKEDTTDSVWDALRKTEGIDQLTFETPTDMAIDWIKKNDPAYVSSSSSFVHTDLRLVDDAYEFVFSSMVTDRRTIEPDVTKQTYLIMPNFVSKSATSLEKFSDEVRRIVATISDLPDSLDLSYFHPEHIHNELRSPVPILTMKWNAGFR